MTPRILIVCPTRERNDKRFALSFLATNPHHSSIIFGTDSDDKPYEHINSPLLSYWTLPRMRSVGTMNLIAKAKCEDASIIGEIGDDSIFRSADWEQKVLAAFTDGALIITTADGRWEEKFPANYFMDARIVQTLGFFMPPTLEHLCGDDFLLALANGLGKTKHLPDVMIEHMHYSLGKAPFDRIYHECNNSHQMQRDEIAYDDYMSERFLIDLERVKATLGIIAPVPELKFKRRVTVAL